MSNEQLLSAFDRYLNGVLNGPAKLASFIDGRIPPSDAPRFHDYVAQARKFLQTPHLVPGAPLQRPMNPEQTKQAVLDEVKSHAESDRLQEMTRDYCSLPEGSFKRDARKIFFDFLQIEQATGFAL